MAARAGTGHLYVPADSRAVYVFDVNRRGPEPEFKKLEPVLLGVLTTGHPPGNLRGVPVFSNPDPSEPGPKFFVLGQAAGFDRMKLRTFRLPDETDAKPDASNSYEIALPGWASFPPYCDGEKLAIVTDRGEFGLYGLALDQNNDDMLFSFQTPAPKASDQRPSRGQVVLAEEGAFWIIAAGQLRHFRFGINMAQGVRAIPHGDPVPVGEPLHAPQVNARGDTFVVVTQDGMTCRATAVDAVTGEVRWRRELGVITKGDPLRIGDAVVVLDQGGGFYRVETKPLLDKSGAAWLLDEKWLLSQPARGFTAYTGLIPGPDGSAFALMVGDGEQAGKLLIRKYSDADKKVNDSSVPAAALPAGQPVVFGKFFVIPLANGNLYRIPLDGGNALQQGPTWRGDRLPGSVSCYLAPINDEELYASDGARNIARWYWSSTNQGFEMRGRLQLTERPGATPIVVPGVPPRLVVADSRGNLTMWDGDKLAPPVMRSWRTDKNNLPAARVADGLRLMANADSTQQIVYSAGGRLVVLPPDRDKPKWISPGPVKAIEGRPVFDGDRVILTDRSGLVRVLDAKTGQATGDDFQLVGSHAFAAAAVPVGNNRFLVPLADGTLVLGELKPRPTEEPKEKGPMPKADTEQKGETSPKKVSSEKK
jgi:outer membrane protein assembly factor BamB